MEPLCLSAIPLDAKGTFVVEMAIAGACELTEVAFACCGVVVEVVVFGNVCPSPIEIGVVILLVSTAIACCSSNLIFFPSD